MNRVSSSSRGKAAAEYGGGAEEWQEDYHGAETKRMDGVEDGAAAEEGASGEEGLGTEGLVAAEQEAEVQQ
jgi:hypothetical protein